MALAVAGCTGIVADNSFLDDGSLPIDPGNAGGNGAVNQGGTSSSGSPNSGSGGAPGASGTPSTGFGGSPGSAGAMGSGTGAPCAVQQLLAAKCLSCHGPTPLAGVPMSLATYANLTSPSRTDPSRTNIQLAAVRMGDTQRPMPPGGGSTALELAAVQNWIGMGSPRTECVAPGGAGGAGGSTGSGGTAGRGSGGTIGAGGSTGPTNNTGVPCDVAQLLSNNCLACHGTTPIAGAPMSLVSYADLTRTSLSNSARSMVQQAVSRMGNTGSPMPPGGGATAAQITILQNWINAGTPRQNCTGGAGGAGGSGNTGNGGSGGAVVTPPDPFNMPTMCSSRTNAPGGNGASMRPGEACINCHNGSAPRWGIAGTVFPTAHEPNGCDGGPLAGGSAQIILTGSDGRTTTLTTNGVGNFYTSGTVAFPFRAQVVYQGRTRSMATPQSNGNCNSCHTVNGANGAPGRIVLP